MGNKIKFGLRAAVSFSILAYLVSRLDWKTVSGLQAEIILIVLLGAGIFFLAQSVMSLRWKLILERATTNPVSYLYLLRTYTIAQFFNLLMPGSVGGDFFRATAASTTYGIDRKTSFTIVISERGFGLSAVSLMVVVGLMVHPTFLGRIGLDKSLHIVAILGAVIAFFVARRLADRSSVMSFSAAITLLLISAFAQLADVVTTYFLTAYFQIDISFTELLIVIPIVYFVTILPISLGGLGVREGAMVLLLSSFNSSDTSAIMIALSLYLTKVIIGLIGGLIFLQSGKKNYN
jgi:uncharacterized membrane protein YbhN (UPF0104 family)